MGGNLTFVSSGLLEYVSPGLCHIQGLILHVTSRLVRHNHRWVRQVELHYVGAMKNVTMQRNNKKPPKDRSDLNASRGCCNVRLREEVDVLYIPQKLRVIATCIKF